MAPLWNHVFLQGNVFWSHQRNFIWLIQAWLLHLLEIWSSYSHRKIFILSLYIVILDTELIFVIFCQRIGHISKQSTLYIRTLSIFSNIKRFPFYNMPHINPDLKVYLYIYVMVKCGCGMWCFIQPMTSSERLLCARYCVEHRTGYLCSNKPTAVSPASGATDEQQECVGPWWSKRESPRTICLQSLLGDWFKSLFRCRAIRPRWTARSPLKLTLFISWGRGHVSFWDLTWNHWNWMCHPDRSALWEAVGVTRVTVWTPTALHARAGRGWQRAIHAHLQPLCSVDCRRKPQDWGLL